MLSSMRLPAFPRPSLPALVLVAATAGLSACGGAAGPQFPPACPQTAFLSDAADLTRFRGPGTDLTDMVVDGRITGLRGKCTAVDADHLRTSVSVSFQLTRGPAMQGRTADLTYLVSASRGDTILDVERFPLHIPFPQNSSTVAVTDEQVEINLPTPGKVSGADYRVLVGFQLTPQELAFNRRRGPR